MPVFTILCCKATILANYGKYIISINSEIANWLRNFGWEIFGNFAWEVKGVFFPKHVSSTNKMKDYYIQNVIQEV